MDYFTVIKIIEKFWKHEIEDPNSVFYQNHRIEKKSPKYFKRWGTTIEKILVSIKHSVVKEQKWYYTQRELANHFGTSQKDIWRSLKKICSNLNLICIKIPSQYTYIKDVKTFSKPKTFLVPPNLTRILQQEFPNIDFQKYKIEVKLKLENVDGFYTMLTAFSKPKNENQNSHVDGFYFMLTADKSNSSVNSNICKTPYIVPIYSVSITTFFQLITNCFAVSNQFQEGRSEENARAHFLASCFSFDIQETKESLSSTNKQEKPTMKSKRVKLNNIFIDKPSSLPPKKTLEEKRTLTHSEDLRPARIKLAIKNLDPQTTLFPRKSLENKNILDSKKSSFRSAKELLAFNKQIEINKMLVKEKILSKKKTDLHNDPLHGAPVKKITKISAEDYGIKKEKIYTIENPFGRWILEILNWVEECDIPPIEIKQAQRFLDYWNSVDNYRFSNKYLKTGSKNFNYLRLALTFRLINHDIDFNKCLSAVDTFSLLLKHRQLKIQSKKIDPLKHFLYSSPRTKDWFEIYIKPKFEAAREVSVKTTEWTLSFDKVLNLFANYFYGKNKTLAENEVTRYYPEYIDWINFLVSEHKKNCIDGGIKFESFLESFFEFLSKFKKGPKFRPSLKFLTDTINLNHYYAQMIEDTGNPDYVLPWKIVKERRKKQEEIQAEYDRLHPEDNN